MNILAFETTEKIGSVAAMCDGNLLAHIRLGHHHRSAQSLAPAMRDLLEQVGWQPRSVQLVAVSIGPGSFTGLRVGVTAAKVFAYAVGAEILGVDTLRTIAAASPDDVQHVSAVIDAQRGDVVTRLFARQPDGLFQPAGPEILLSIEAWLEQLPQGVAVSGPILTKLVDRLPPYVRVLDHACWLPHASTVAQLAEHDYAEGRRGDLWKLGPRYSRQAAAEEKWLAQHAPGPNS